MVVLAVLIRLTVVGFLAITLITELFITANTKSAFAKTNKTISALVLIFPLFLLLAAIQEGEANRTTIFIA